MRILVLGAGATGGYYGGRLVEAGADVTFLVRSKRAQQLKQNGLVVKSKYGDLKTDVKVIEKVDQPYDIVLLSCKAFDLNSSIDAIAPAVGEQSAVFPLLNGMRHVDTLMDRFGGDRVLGGLCQISSTLDEDGEVIHLNDQHFLRFGELSGKGSKRVDELAAITSKAIMKADASETILHDMWDKWTRLSALAGITCLMRSSIGDIARSPQGKELETQLFNECVSVGTAHGFNPRGNYVSLNLTQLTDESSALTASMLRDIERGNKVEGDHILGDLIDRAEEKTVAVPLLRTAYCHIKAYEQRQARNS